MDETYIKLFAEHQRTIYALIRSFCRRPQDADDIFQETCLVAWRKRAEFQPGSNFLAWVGSIARFETLAHARREGRSCLIFDESLLETLAEHAVAQAAGADARLRALRCCLEALSASHRELIERRYASFASVKSIAAQVGRSANSVSVTLHAIRQKLLDYIERRIAAEEP